MKRTQIQLDDEMYAAVRQRAFEARQSISAVVRESLASALNLRRTRTRPIGQFGFVGSGRSRQRRGQRVSERHDAALVEALATLRKRRR